MIDGVNARGSVRRRLILFLLTGAALLAVILFIIVQEYARRLAEESQDNILSASAISVLDASSVQAGELALDLPYAAFSMLGNLSDDRVFYAFHRGEEFLSGYEELQPLAVNPGAGPKFATRIFKGVEVRVTSAGRRLSLDGQPINLTITIAQTRNGQHMTLARISRGAAILGLGFFVITAILAMFAAHSAIHPLQRLTLSVGRRGPQDLRPVAAPVPAEMVPLVGALNRFMERLKASLTRSEEFIADAAHRVRTPLATVRAKAEILLHRMNKNDNRQILREMIRAIDESSRTAGQLLDHAMVSFRSDQVAHEQIDLTQLAQEMVERLRPLAELRDIEISLKVQDELSICGDLIMIQSALRNMMDNAIKYAPPDSQITLHVVRDNQYASLRIVDEGAGFVPGEIGSLTKRFMRGTNVEAVVGSGLGLTIVDEVARAHGGALAIRNRQEGNGACVCLSLPLS